MKPEPVDEGRGDDKARLLKAAGIAAALGVLVWLLTPFLLPVKVPKDFPTLPDLSTANAGLRAALQAADQAARQRPGSAEAVGKLGMAYHSNLFFEQAEQAYRIAARLDPGDGQWAYCRAFLQEENGGGEKQVEFLRETVRLQSDHVPALIKLADWSFKVDRMDEAAQYYGAAAKARDGSAVLLGTFGLGRVSARRKEWSKTVEHVSPLLASYSHVASVHELLLEAYEALGQADKAAMARQGIALAKWKVIPPPEDALNEQLIAVCYDSTRLLKQAGLLSRLGHPDKALQVARRATQIVPTDPDIRNLIASTLITFYGDQPQAVDEALTQIAECLRLRPDDPMPLWAFADEFFKSPKPPPAIERLRTLMRPRANLPDSHYFLGLAADAQGEIGEAVAQYQAALKSNPGNSAVYNKLGLISDGAGKFNEAIVQFQKAIQLNPVNTTARFNLGIALMQSNNYGQALREFEELLRFNPYDPSTHFSMGFAYLYLKRTDEAIARFREGLRYRPDDAEAHFGLGQAFAAQRRRDEAVAELRMVLRLRPDDRPARELLYELEH